MKNMFRYIILLLVCGQEKSGLSPGAVAGICIFFLSVMAAAAAAGVIFYRRMSEQKKLLDDMKTVIVKEGDPLTLSAGVTDIQSDDVIQWRFGETLIAEIRRKKMKIYTDDDDVQRFRDRLKLKDQTGSLTISDIRPEHTGLYKLKIITSEGTSQSLFNVVVTDEDPDWEKNMFSENMETVSVMKGRPLTLYTGVTYIKSDYVIQWRFGETLIAEIKRKKMKIYTDDDDVERFRDTLKLNDQTADLTISKSRPEHTGLYKLKIITSRETSAAPFRVNVMKNVKLVKVMKGDPLILSTGVTDIQSDDVFQWRFGETLIAEIKRQEKKIYTDDDDVQGFSNRVKLNDQTGDLIIRDISTEDAGLYKLKIITSEGTSQSLFNVIVTENMKTVSVKEGESFPLSTDVTDIQSDDVIEWMFGETLIAEIKRQEMKIYRDDDDERLIDRLELDDQTGNLTIRNISTEDAGHYKLKIITSRGTSQFLFNVVVKKNMNTVSVMKGDPLTLSTGVTYILSDDVIQWRFGETLIAEIKRQEKKIYTDDDDVQRFRDRLTLKDQTGDLIISDISTEDTGLYKLKIITSRITFQSLILKFTTKGTLESLFNVVVSENVKKVSVMEGESFILSTGVTDIQSDDDVFQWRFGETLIAEIKRQEKKIYTGYDAERFRDRLKLKDQTGSLTISGISTEHTGLYKLKIITSEGTSQSLFNVVVKVTVRTGQSVPLQTGGEIQRGDQIQWISKDKVTLVTGEIGHRNKTKYTDDERFRGRVKMNHQTGDLTIRDTRQTDAGEYTLKISRDGRTSDRMFSVCVSDEDPERNLNKLESGIRGNDSAGIRGNESAGIRGNESAGIRGNESAGIRGNESAGIRGNDSAGIRGNDSSYDAFTE